MNKNITNAKELVNEMEMLRKEFTKEDLKNFIECLDPQEKAIVLLMASSGMNSDTILKLTFEDFMKSINHTTGMIFPISQLKKFREYVDQFHVEIIGTWNFMTKTGSYSTFNSPEATKATLDYVIGNKNISKNIFNPLFGYDESNFSSKVQLEVKLLNASMTVGVLIDETSLIEFFNKIISKDGVNWTLKDIDKESKKEMYSKRLEDLRIGITREASEFEW
jgi:hypothetical protein